MATRQVITFVSDLSGPDLSAGTEATDPRNRRRRPEIDLTEDEGLQGLRAALNPYVTAARKSSVREWSPSVGTTPRHPATEQQAPYVSRGPSLGPRERLRCTGAGCIPPTVMEAFQLAT